VDDLLLAYLAVVGYLFGEKHPKAVPNLLMFMRQILDFAQTYQWSEAVLPLALNSTNTYWIKESYRRTTTWSQGHYSWIKKYLKFN
jgi:hypothetical protein